MAYTKNTWLDQQVERPKTYKVIDNEDETITLVDSFGTVTVLGTFVNAVNMNHIEDGIADNDERITQNSADILDLQNTDKSLSTQITEGVQSAKDYTISILKTIYPVGSIYIGTTSTCPLAALFGTWTLVSNGRALWTGNGSNANTTIAAGLPNITGTAGRFERNTDLSPLHSGALRVIESTTATGPTGSRSVYVAGIGFNSSYSNSIYGQSSTVQPPAYVVNVWRRTT